MGGGEGGGGGVTHHSRMKRLLLTVRETNKQSDRRTAMHNTTQVTFSLPVLIIVNFRFDNYPISIAMGGYIRE